MRAACFLFSINFFPLLSLGFSVNNNHYHRHNNTTTISKKYEQQKDEKHYENTGMGIKRRNVA